MRSGSLQEAPFSFDHFPYSLDILDYFFHILAPFDPSVRIHPLRDANIFLRASFPASDSGYIPLLNKIF